MSDRGTAGALFAGTLMVVGGFFGWAFTVILIDLWIIHSLFVHKREYV